MTAAPSTTAPRTSAPIASPPTDTPVPATRAPVTNPPATRAPATSAPMTAAPETDAPLTTAPRTTVPLTTAPATTAPSGAPATAAPVVRDNLSLLADAVASGTTVASGTSFANLIDDDLATYWSPNGVPTEISIEWATPKVLSGFNIIEAPGFTDIVQSWILLEAETERVMASGTGVDGPVVVEYAKGVKKVTFKVFNTAIDTPRPRVVEFQTFGWEVTGAPQTPAPETAAPPTTAAPPIKTPPTNAPATTAPPTNAPSTLSPAPPGDNLSLLGDASASGSSAAPGTSFADMIDDDVNTFWSPTSLPATIVIRWAAPKSVSSINIVEYLPMVSDSAGGRASDFPGSINGWSLIDEEGDRVLASGNGFSGPITFDAVVLSDIRLSIFDASGGMPRVAEFQTFGVDPALPDNLSLRDDAVADGSSELPGNSFAAAIDGRFETFWAPASLPANISVEWPSARAVGSVEIYEYFSTVSVTDSGLASDLLPGRIGSWTLVGEFGAVLASGSGIRGPISLDGSSLRKVTLVIFDSTGGMPSVAEFETYAEGTITSPVPDNLSLLRDASASGSTAAPGASFANAIDDDGSTYWSPTSLPAQISVEWATAKLVSSVYIVEQRQIFPTRTGATQAVGFPGSIGAWSLVDESGSVLASGTGITDEVYFAAVSTRKVTLNIFDSGDVMPRVSEFETYNDGTPTSPVLDNLSLLPSASADGSTAAPGTSFANAIDGSLDTIWSPITLPAYISVEWPTERLVSSVVIVEQPFIASGRGAAAQAISFAGSIGAWNLETEFGDVLASGTGIHAEIFFDGVYLRKVTLNIIDAGDMLPRVSEFETYADGAPPVREPENLSLLRDAVADGSTAAPGTSFANAIDGDLDTIWRPSDLPASISVEWSTERLISSVVIVEQQVIPSGRSMATQAVEGVIEAWSLTDEGGDRILASGTGIVGPITFPPTILQKVVFRIFTADGLPRISEFETFVRTPEVPVIDNLSLLKDAVAGGSSAASGTSFANAIDGDLSTVWSPTVVPAEISVEWSTERLISSVVILEQPPIISGRNMATQAANFPSNIGSWELMDEEGDRIIASGTGIDGPISFSPTFVRKVVLLIFTADGNPRVAEFETFGESPVSPVHDNLSLLRGAVASGTSEASGSTFAGVIDGRLTTYWSPASLPAQISVEWPIPQTVGSVVIVEQSAVPSSRHGAAQAVGFPGDIGAWTLRDFDGDRVLASGTGIRGPITFAAVSLRKLTLDIAEAGDGVPRIFEFETYSGAAGSDNLALALDTIAVGSTSESGTSSSNVIDDDASTYWSPTSLSASISVEWATERLVGSVNIVESLGFTGNIRTWTLLDWEGDAVLASGEGGLGGEISFAAVSLRKIVLDIEANAGGMPRVAEFQVYAPKVLPLPAPGNLFRRDGATASGSTAASGSSFAAAIDGSAATYWSPLVVPGRISVEWPSVQLVASVVVVEAVGFAGGVRSWMLVDDDADSVLASGTGVAGPINFSPASLRRISLQILTADGIVRIAELEAYSLPVPVVAV
ncbi:hypothetical protein DIPPA_27710 [Diplonema papillatum]|nr:hypothetical protein DIPPA_27710 [Diplonema papillatum]